MVGGNGVHGYLLPAVALTFALLMPTTSSQTTAAPTSTPTEEDTPGPTFIPECKYGINLDTSVTCVEVEGVLSSCGALDDLCYIGTCYGSECANGTLTGTSYSGGIGSNCDLEEFVDGDCDVEYKTLEDVEFPCEYSEGLECAELTPAPALALQLSGGCALNTCCECTMDIERDLGMAAINCQGFDQLLCGPVECIAISAGFVTCEYPCTDGTAVTTGSEEFDGWNSAEGRVDCGGGDCVAVLDDCPEDTEDDDNGEESTPSPVVVSETPSPAVDDSPVVEPSSPTTAPSSPTTAPSADGSPTEGRSAATKMGGVRAHELLPFVLPAILTVSFLSWF